MTSYFRSTLSGGSAANSDIAPRQPLHFAAGKGDCETVELLCRHGNGRLTVNAAPMDGYTALHLAAESGHYKVVEKLLLWGADPQRIDEFGRTPLDVASEHGRNQVVELLTNWTAVSRMVNVDNNQMTCLHLAARNGHCDVIRTLLRAGVDVNIQTSRGTALHEASMFGRAEVVRLLLVHGIDVNRVNSYEQTALDIVSKFTANKAARQIQLMLRGGIGCTLERSSSEPFRHLMPVSQTFSDLPSKSNVSVRDGTVAYPRRLSCGPFDDNVHYLSGSQSVRSDRGRDNTRLYSAHQAFSANREILQSPTLSDCSTSTTFSQDSVRLSDDRSTAAMYRQDRTLAERIAQTEEKLVSEWLARINLSSYTRLFVNAGYDLPTIARMTPEDMTAVGITEPSVRKTLKTEIAKLAMVDYMQDFKPTSVAEVLHHLNLDIYREYLARQGFVGLKSLMNLTWEDLEDVGIRKLGHQKKMMLAVDWIRRVYSGRRCHSSSNGEHRQPTVIPECLVVSRSSTFSRPTCATLPQVSQSASESDIELTAAMAASRSRDMRLTSLFNRLKSKPRRSLSGDDVTARQSPPSPFTASRLSVLRGFHRILHGNDRLSKSSTTGCVNSADLRMKNVPSATTSSSSSGELPDVDRTPTNELPHSALSQRMQGIHAGQSKGDVSGSQTLLSKLSTSVTNSNHRPSAKVLPSLKSEQPCQDDDFKEITFHPVDVDGSSNDESSILKYGTLPRRRNLQAFYVQQASSSPFDGISSTAKPETFVQNRHVSPNLSKHANLTDYEQQNCLRLTASEPRRHQGDRTNEKAIRLGRMPFSGGTTTAISTSPGITRPSLHKTDALTSSVGISSDNRNCSVEANRAPTASAKDDFVAIKLGLLPRQSDPSAAAGNGTVNGSTISSRATGRSTSVAREILCDNVSARTGASSELLSDIDGMLTGLAAELDLILQNSS